jgi:protein-S-isoprenylcysteine O-methyltransferase Ste14
MARLRAAAGSVVFLAVAPGMVAGLIPWLLTDWESSHPPVVLGCIGAAMVVVGAVVLLHAFARFVVDGIGTPAPVAPTEQLVVRGPYRYVRNPMYLAVGTVIGGQALLLGQAVLIAYLGAYALAVEAFVRLYEEPSLAGRYGAEYDRYVRAVPRWLPSLRSPDGS